MTIPLSRLPVPGFNVPSDCTTGACAGFHIVEMEHVAAMQPGVGGFKRHAVRVIMEEPLLDDPRVPSAEIEGGNSIQFIQRKYLRNVEPRRPAGAGQRPVLQEVVVVAVNAPREFGDKARVQCVSEMNRPVVNGIVL